MRNSRGGQHSVGDRSRAHVHRCGAPGITVHPRADERHITTQDVHEIAEELAPLRAAGGLAKEHRVEFNIEGDPRPGFPGAGPRGQARSVHAGAGEARRDHQRSGLAGRHARGDPRRHHRRVESRRRSRQPVRRSGAGGDSLGEDDGRGSRGVVHGAVRARVRARAGCGGGELREIHRGRQPRVRARRRRERGTRSRSEEPDALQDAAAPGRGLDRARARSAARSSSALAAS